MTLVLLEIETLCTRRAWSRDHNCECRGSHPDREALRMRVCNSWQSFTVLVRRLVNLQLGARVLGSGSRTTEFSRNSRYARWRNLWGETSADSGLHYASRWQPRLYQPRTAGRNNWTQRRIQRRRPQDNRSRT